MYSSRPPRGGSSPASLPALLCASLTLPPKTSLSGFGVLHRLREGELDEREAVYRGADHRGAQGVRGRSRDEGPLPTAWHQRAELLPLEGEVRRDGRQRRQEAQAARG